MDIQSLIQKFDDTEDFEGANLPVPPGQIYFYIIANPEKRKHPVPAFVFPDFARLFDWMETLLQSGSGWSAGRILIDGPFFEVRKPYLQRFLIRQELSVSVFDLVFSESETRPSSKIPANRLQKFEDEIMKGKP